MSVIARDPERSLVHPGPRVVLFRIAACAFRLEGLGSASHFVSVLGQLAGKRRQIRTTFRTPSKPGICGSQAAVDTNQVRPLSSASACGTSGGVVGICSSRLTL